MMSNELVKRIVAVTIVIAGMAGLMAWSANHDKEVAEGADRYEKCIRQEYGVSPATWYNEHGAYPECHGTLTAK